VQTDVKMLTITVQRRGILPLHMHAAMFASLHKRGQCSHGCVYFMVCCSAVACTSVCHNSLWNSQFSLAVKHLLIPVFATNFFPSAF